MPTRALTASPATPTQSPGAQIADPAPLGLAAFALTTFLLSCVNAGLVPTSVEPVVFGVALMFGGVAQFAAGMWEFAKGNTFGATAFTAYGAFWLSFWWLTGHLGEYKIPADDVGTGVGLYLLGWTIFTVYMTVAACRVSGAILTVFVVLSITFLALTLGDLTGVEGLTRTGGYLGLVTAAAAWYTSFAGVAASTFGRPVVPTGPR